MDPITHGITGALLGKGIFSEREGRMATFAATLGAIFPDVDIVAEAISRDPLAIVKYHRGITHSFVALPFFAVLLAWLTRYFTRRRGIPCPSWPMLTLIYGVGIASHILLDGTTSFGTRMWTPISQKRVAWDLMFIIDFVLSSCVLLPQVLAWVYHGSDAAATRKKATWMWALFSVAAVLVWGTARVAGYPFHIWIVLAASAIFAALFSLPAANGWGFRMKRSAWCQAGILVTLVYVGCCGMAHHAALRRVQDFAAANHVNVVRMGALPVPPSLLDWGDVIRTHDGVYQARFDLRDAAGSSFLFCPGFPTEPFHRDARARCRKCNCIGHSRDIPTIHTLPRMATTSWISASIASQTATGARHSPFPIAWLMNDRVRWWKRMAAEWDVHATDEAGGAGATNEAEERVTP